MDGSEKEMLREAVYEIVRLIPPGRVTSYAAIARACGYPDHSRMIGRIMAGCSDEGVPTHRVVNSQGILSGWAAFGGIGKMESLLEEEGVCVENNRIKGWKKVFWNPLNEI